MILSLSIAWSEHSDTDFTKEITSEDSFSNEYKNYARLFNVSQLPLPWPGYAIGNKSRYKVGDFDDDGKDDLIHFVNNHVNIWKNYANGNFTVKSFRPWPGYAIGDGRKFKLGDLDGDNDTDLIHFVNTHVNVWLSDESHKLFDINIYYPEEDVGWGGKFKVGDIITDHDGIKREDLLYLPSDDTTTFYIWKSLGDGTFQVIDITINNNFPI